MNLKIPDLECCFACQLPRKSQPVCHAAPEKRWAATRRLNVGIQSEDSEDEWMAEWQICFCKFSYEFCLCSVWVLVDHVYQKRLENRRRFIPFHSAFAPFCWQLVVPLGMQHWPTGQPSSSPPPASVGWLNPGEMALVGMKKIELIIMFWFERVDWTSFRLEQ